ncbi:MAG: hypothetical protein NXI24_21255 [bacterium]|nr:hypothetical protein [bacterium]
MKPSQWISAALAVAMAGGLMLTPIASLILVDSVAAQPDRGPESFDWGLDTGEESDSPPGGQEDQTNSSKAQENTPDAMRMRAAAHYVQFRNARLRKNRLIRSELIRMGDKPFAKVYQSLVLPRRTLKRARGRVEAGLEDLFLKISRKIDRRASGAKREIVRVRLERVSASGGQGSVLVRTPGPNGGNFDPVIFVYRVKDNGTFESDVIFRPGS